MSYFSRLTIKSQVTIPRDVRAALGVGPGERVAFDLRPDGRVELHKAVQPTLEEERTRYRGQLASVRGIWSDGRSTDEIMREIRGDDEHDDLR